MVTLTILQKYNQGIAFEINLCDVVADVSDHMFYALAFAFYIYITRYIYYIVHFSLMLSLLQTVFSDKKPTQYFIYA